MLKIELKNIQYAAFASQETNCYSATLYIDDEKWGTVGNEGHGGSDYFHAFAGRSYGDLPALDERIAAEYPPIDMSEYDMEPMTPDLESVCGQIVDTWLVEKDFKRALKKAILFYKETPLAKGASLYEVPLKGRTFEQLKGAMAQRHPGAIILNALPVEQALPLYRMAG